jgi:hypothetical protein
MWLRGTERLLVVFGGLGFVVCGMLLFKWGVGGPAKLIVEAKEFKAQLVNAAPGLVVLLFGAVMLGLGTLRSAEYKSEQTSTGQKTSVEWKYSREEIDETRKFLHQFSGNENEKLTEAEVKQFRERAGKLLAKLNADKAP